MDFLKRPLADYLVHKFGAKAQLVRDERFPRGSSRMTWFVDYLPAPGEPLRSLVFRANLASGSTIPTSLEQEFFMYDRLGRTAVPVARALFWESDPDWADRPFYVREQVEGSWEIPHFDDPDPQYDDLRIAISREHMRKLALVHTMDWRAQGFDERLSAPADEASCAAHFIDMLASQLEEFRAEPLPLVTEAIAVLKSEAPVAPCISLCKGTNGLGEEVFRDGEIVAMSDWEEASIGDPAADFASLQNFAPEIDRDGENLWGMEKALAYYREISGIALSIENVRFYQRVRAFNTIIYGHKAATGLHGGKGDIRQAWTGTEVQHLGKRMTANTIGLMPAFDPSWFADLNLTVS
jgi:aminoglycoside phosphotransferase (APT) family kinase protein